MKKYIYAITIIFYITLPVLLWAKIDLVTLPSRDKVSLTLYKKPDMTIVREIRNISLRQGINELQFSWLNTQVDPTSIDMTPIGEANDINIENLCFPPNIKKTAIWKINSTKDDTFPMKLSYLTSGLDWRAYYSAILSSDETKMQLNGFVRINNFSGETFENAKISLVMGKVNMVEPVIKLAKNHIPYGQPGNSKNYQKRMRMKKQHESMAIMETMSVEPPIKDSFLGVSNEIHTASASEYAVFEIEREEQLNEGWGKQLIFLEKQSIPITNVYRFHPQKYGENVIRLIIFNNDFQGKKAKSDKLPLPGGLIRIYRDIYKMQHFSYEGKTHLNDIPVGKEVEIELGYQNQVIVEKKRMKKRTDHYKFNDDGNITGWEEYIQDRIELNNTRSVSVLIEIICTFDASDWILVQKNSWVSYEKIDQHSVKFSAKLAKKTNKAFLYDLTINRKGPQLLKGSRLGVFRK